MDARLPAHLEVNGLIRAVEAAGGFALVLNKGERDAGTILVVTRENDDNSHIYERMPQLDGSRAWTAVSLQNTENPHYISEYCEKRARQDPDLWILELDIANGERFIGL